MKREASLFRGRRFTIIFLMLSSNRYRAQAKNG
jgi:hypothetical protein